MRGGGSSSPSPLLVPDFVGFILISFYPLYKTRKMWYNGMGDER